MSPLIWRIPISPIGQIESINSRVLVPIDAKERTLTQNTEPRAVHGITFLMLIPAPILL
jgi:hypothetical protein